uniref:Uncharacterized protein n=1 Tax=Branchiostoma floridae TaxID=7739 RepID=C3Y0T3_BRAFL|eukprot:XP_002610056.1 hypothetical protein BRAFLDRAFT_125688 [Branchiostoma floridae]
MSSTGCHWLADMSPFRSARPTLSTRCCLDKDCDPEVPEVDDEGRLTLVELNPPEPWERDPRPPQRIEPGEVQVTFFAHACMEVKLGDKTMFFDPWLTGPAFARGWWLQHEPPADWLERLSRADLIYISHEHSDHLRSPDPEHRGVCVSPNGGRLPKNVDIMMSDFSGGNSGFPVTFSGGRYTEEWKERFMANDRKNLLFHKKEVVREVNPKVYCPFGQEWKERFMANDRKNLLFHKKEVVREVNPKVYCPFAGFFLEAHPADKYILNNNPKNKPEQLAAFINRHLDSVMTWTPKPGSTVDLALALGDPADRRLAIVDPPPETKLYKDTWDFDFYIDKINESIDNEIFAYPDWIPFYYEWIGFKNYDLVLRMIETDDYFQPVEGGYDFLVDFMDLSFPSQRPTRKHAYLEIKNRIGVHRQTVLHGLFWDDLYLGFQNRLSRDPDTFHFKFWNHVQILLSLQPPDWEGFLSRQRKHSGKLPRAVWKPPRSKPTVCTCVQIASIFIVQIKNRIGVHRQTVLHGLFWDDLYLGFQNRLSRDPDTFHFKFWNHVQILLSLQPPDWEGFLSKQRSLHSGKLPRAVWKPPRSKPTVTRLLGVLVQAKALLVPATMALLAILAYNVL